MTAAGGNRFVDAVQDGTHRFITDVERSKWNDILRQAKEYAVAQAQAEAAASQATAVGLAKAHTDQTAAAVRDELALGDQAAVNAAKAYADRIVAALVDNSPELLNTLEELAAALGGDPEFATTVMQAIGQKANASHTHGQGDLSGVVVQRPRYGGGVNTWGCATGFSEADEKITPNGGASSFLSFGQPGHEIQMRLDGYGDWQGGWNRFYFRSKNNDNGSVSAWREFYHSGNFEPAKKAEKTYVDTELGKKASTSHTHGSGDLSGVLVAKQRYSGGVNARGNAVGFSEADEKITPNGGASSFLSFGLSGYEVQLRLDGYGDWLGGRNRLYFRSYDNDSQSFSAWKEFYHSGNLKIIRGSVGANGHRSGGSGFGAYPEGDFVVITHDLGTDYCFTATAHRTNLIGLLEIYEKGNNYLKVGFGKSNGSYAVNAFDFMLSSY